MGFWDTFTLGNIDDIRYKPVETVCDMISEPSKKDTMGSGFWENLTLGKIDDIIYKPVETVCDNISEKNK